MIPPSLLILLLALFAPPASAAPISPSAAQWPALAVDLAQLAHHLHIRQRGLPHLRTFKHLVEDELDLVAGDSELLPASLVRRRGALENVTAPAQDPSPLERSAQYSDLYTSGYDGQGDEEESGGARAEETRWDESGTGEDGDEEDWDDYEDSEEQGESIYDSPSARSTPSTGYTNQNYTDSADIAGGDSVLATAQSASVSEGNGANSSSAGATSTAPGTYTSDCAILGHLYTSLGAAHWPRNTGWSSTFNSGPEDCCAAAYGVSCDRVGRVSALDLAANNLAGPLDDALFQLSSLVRLSLSQNALTGPIPDPFANTPGMTALHLDSNLLTGPVPASLGAARGLESLDLFSNQLFGPFPTLTGLGHLTTFSIVSNYFSGPFPATDAPAELTTCKVDTLTRRRVPLSGRPARCPEPRLQMPGAVQGRRGAEGGRIPAGSRRAGGSERGRVGRARNGVGRVPRGSARGVERDLNKPRLC